MPSVFSPDGTSIAYSTAGSGPALILVDGAMCYRAFGISHYVPFLTPHFTVFHYDRRGRGESTDSQPYAIAREVEDLGAVIEAAGGHAFVLGMSSGGALVLEAAIAGLPIDGAAVYEVPLGTDEAARSAFADYRKKLEAELAEGRRGDAVALFLSLVGTPPEAIEQMRGSPSWPVMEAIAPTLAYDAALTSEGAALLGERGRDVRVPTLVMAGSASPPMLQEPIARLARAIPGAVHRLLPDQTHNADAEIITSELISFFGALAASRTGAAS